MNIFDFIRQRQDATAAEKSIAAKKASEKVGNFHMSHLFTSPSQLRLHEKAAKAHIEAAEAHESRRVKFNKMAQKESNQQSPYEMAREAAGNPITPSRARANIASHEALYHKAQAATHLAKIATGKVGKDLPDTDTGAALALQHKEAGEAHLRAAELHASRKLFALPIAHKEQASQHAAAAGGEWDETKHPRDENGKFS